MNYSIKDLQDEVQGKDIYLIGGGKSFDPETHIPMLPVSRVVTLNAALGDFKECLAVMWMDSNWYGENTKLIREQRPRYAVEFTINNQRPETRNTGRIRIRNASCSKCDYTTKREKYNVCGNNTGCCAIDLLDQLGAKTIYLLGFDCREDDGVSHYHKRYKNHVKQAIYDKNFIPCFERLSKHISTSRVVNLSENSRIGCFKKSSINNLLKGEYK